MRRISDWFRRRGKRTLKIPATGRAIVLSDLHGHWDDWKAFCDTSGWLARLEDGEDLWLLITGDIPDVARHQTVDPRVPDDGDVRIVDDLIQARASLGSRGERIVYLEGNHDYHVARICLEAAHYQAIQHGTPPPTDGDLPPSGRVQYEEYCAFYKETFGQQMFENNIAPYDMVPRAKNEHLQFLKSGPILAVLEGARVLVTHAGPPRMEHQRARDLLRRIETASAKDLRNASREAYYASPYHQLLNNRYPNGNYSLADLDRFCAAYDASVLITGHTPHPYLIDFQAKTLLRECGFRDGIGMIGSRQVVLCSSFGAFQQRWKRYLELDLTVPCQEVSCLFEDERTIRPVYSPEAEDPTEALPGIDIALGSNV